MSEKMGLNLRKVESKSNFSVTCSLLSQYVKEKGRFGDLAFGIPNRPHESVKGAVGQPIITMNLLPGVDVSADEHTDTEDKVSDRNVTKSMDLFPQYTGFADAAKTTDTKQQETKAPLTIFYGGKVLVLANFPAEKANDLMQFASNGSSAAPPTASLAVAPLRPAQPNASDLHMPMSRKASLHRFLEKRKERINANAPYQAINGCLAKPENHKA